MLNLLAHYSKLLLFLLYLFITFMFLPPFLLFPYSLPPPSLLPFLFIYLIPLYIPLHFILLSTQIFSSFPSFLNSINYFCNFPYTAILLSFWHFYTPQLSTKNIQITRILYWHILPKIIQHIHQN